MLEMHVSSHMIGFQYFLDSEGQYERLDKKTAHLQSLIEHLIGVEDYWVSFEYFSRY